MDLQTALAESCDTYFYELGQRFYDLPPDRGHPLQALGEPLRPRRADAASTSSPRSAGLIPTPEWRRAALPGEPGLRRIDRIWKPGYSIQLAIGQGQVLVTPLQMARLYAMIANGGKLVTPHLAEDVELTGNDGQPARILRRFGAQPPQPTGVDPTALRVRPARASTRRRTRRSARRPASSATSRSTIAGKTGTPRRSITLPGYPHPLNLTQSWWCGYGPSDSPTIVVCAVIENGGHGGTAAAPAALKVFEQYFGKHGDHDRAPTRATDGDRGRRHDERAGCAPPRSREAVGARRRCSPPRLDPAAPRSRRSSAYGLWAIDGITRTTPAARRSRGRRSTPSVGARALRRRRCSSIPTATAAAGGRSTSGRSA